jgi:outer membrane protein TolC
MKRRGCRRASRRVGSLVSLTLLSAAVLAQTVDSPPSAANPIDLATTLRLAGAQNLDVELARNAVMEARANHASAIEKFLPALVPSANYLRHSGRAQVVDGTIVDVTKHSDATGVGVSAHIVVGDAIFSTLQSRQFVTAADAAATGRERDSALIAAQQYFDLVRAQALANVVQQGLAVSQNYLQQLGEAVRIGIAFKGDALRVETQTQRLELELARAKQQRRLAAAKLAQTLHLDPLVDLAPADADPVPLALADLTATPRALLQTALDNRPELTQSTALIAAAEHYRRGAVYGPLFPTVGAQAFAGDLHGGPDDVDMNGGDTRDRMLALSWKLGPGGLFDWGRIRASNSKLVSAQLMDEKLRDEISRQVVDSHTRVQSLFEQVRIARLNMNSAAETLRMTRERKELGVGTVLEDIQAQQELVRARSEYVGSVTELNQEQYGLLRAIGSTFAGR